MDKNKVGGLNLFDIDIVKNSVGRSEAKVETQPVSIFISSPTVGVAAKLTKEDVWGAWSEDYSKKLSNGMLVATSGEECPVFKDTVPYKSVTVVCDSALEEEVIYWLEYVHGGNSVVLRKELSDNKIALRSDYQCW